MRLQHRSRGARAAAAAAIRVARIDRPLAIRRRMAATVVSAQQEGPSCKADVAYNFGPASGGDDRSAPLRVRARCHARRGPHRVRGAHECPRAAGLDEVAYGAARPGAVGQRCFDEKDIVQDDEGVRMAWHRGQLSTAHCRDHGLARRAPPPRAVVAYASFLKGQGVRRVVGLLSESEVKTYATPPSQVLRCALA